MLKVFITVHTISSTTTLYDSGRQTVTLDEIGLYRGCYGHENIGRTELVHMDQRMYDSSTGRFLSPNRSAEGRLPKQELRAVAGELAELQQVFVLHQQSAEIH